MDFFPLESCCKGNFLVRYILPACCIQLDDIYVHLWLSNTWSAYISNFYLRSGGGLQSVSQLQEQIYMPFLKTQCSIQWRKVLSNPRHHDLELNVLTTGTQQLPNDISTFLRGFISLWAQIRALTVIIMYHIYFVVLMLFFLQRVQLDWFGRVFYTEATLPNNGVLKYFSKGARIRISETIIPDAGEQELF